MTGGKGKGRDGEVFKVPPLPAKSTLGRPDSLGIGDVFGSLGSGRGPLNGLDELEKANKTVVLSRCLSRAWCLLTMREWMAFRLSNRLLWLALRNMG